MAIRNVVIVGAGPAGMALAYLLARRGVGVTVLETHLDFTRAFRGEGLQQSGLDALRQMGLGEQLERVPHLEGKNLEIYQNGQLRVRTDLGGVGRGGVRLVSQPALLAMLADEAGKFPAFRIVFGVTVRDLVHENGRVVGVRADGPTGSEEYRADFVIGTDGRNSATRKHGAFQEITSSQNFDILWVKVPYADCYPNRSTVITASREGHVAIVFPTADGQLQLGMVISKGSYAALRAGGGAAWTEEFIRILPKALAEHVRRYRDLVAKATLLNVVCGRLTEWSAPGLLLLGDAAHPMSPVGGQGVNVALRDTLVAANHLVPVLLAGGDGAALDAAARRIRDERWPEIVTLQELQQRHARVMFSTNKWKARLIHWLMPLLLRSGLAQRLFRKQNQMMSHGAVPVRLMV